MAKTLLNPQALDTRMYECSILYPTNLTQKEEQDLLKEIDALFEETGATVVDKDIWKKRGLAYPIKKHDEGRFIIYYLEMKGESLKTLDTQLKLIRNLLRHLIIRLPQDFELIKFSEVMEAWFEYKEGKSKEQKQKKEEELKKKIVKKAMVKDGGASKPSGDESDDDMPELDERIDELISDEDLNL